MEDPSFFFFATLLEECRDKGWLRFTAPGMVQSSFTDSSLNVTVIRTMRMSKRTSVVKFIQFRYLKISLISSRLSTSFLPWPT